MTTEKRILHLTLKKEWFDKIAKGEKTIEYREIKQYWKTRLLYDNNFYKPKIYDEIHFRNGYSKSSPYMRIESVGLSLFKFDGMKATKKWHFGLMLGKVLEIRNWKQ